jgi:hypothetical protein
MTTMARMHCSIHCHDSAFDRRDDEALSNVEACPATVSGGRQRWLIHILGDPATIATLPSASCAAAPSRSALSAKACPCEACPCEGGGGGRPPPSNPSIKVDDILGRWVPYIVGARSSIVVGLGLTDGACPRT